MTAQLFDVGPAKPRGRAERDFYSTPHDASDVVLPKLRCLVPGARRILEPSAGDGALLAGIAATWPRADIIAIDIEPQHEAVTEANFLGRRGCYARNDFDLIIGNPPYSLAADFIDRALECVRDRGVVAFLLRHAYFAPAARDELIAHHGVPYRGYLLRKRPRFRGNGSDFSEYSWYVWRKGRRATATIVERI